MRVESISAVTLAVRDMTTALGFYQRLGFEVAWRAGDASFATLKAGGQYLNLAVDQRYAGQFWGRIIFHVADVDAAYATAIESSLAPHFAPRDAPWGERYFHISDPDGHELSFARPLS